MAKNRKSKVKLDIDISNSMLEDLMLFMASSNALVTKRLRRKLYDFLKMINENFYEDDLERLMKIKFMKKFLECYIDKNITQYERVMNICCENAMYLEEMENIQDFMDEMAETGEDLSDEEVVAIDEYITSNIRYGFISEYIGPLENMCVAYRAADYERLSEFCKQFEEIVDRMGMMFKKVKETDKEALNDFDSNNLTNLEDVITKTHAELNRPNNKIQTSVKMLNKMIQGGYECGRFYLFLGYPGGWKSGQLLNAALDAKHYCKDIKTADPTKKPSILYVTQENSIRETLERLWSHYVGDDRELKDESPEEIMQILNEYGFSKGINLRIKYRKSKSISTADVDGFIDEMETDGYECVMLLHDYMKRIRSTQNYPDQYMELGEVCDEFCSIAKHRNIPVISASQLNREAQKVLESANGGKRKNVIKNLGASHIGESIRMIDNSDVVIIIGRETLETTGEDFITYKLQKYRGKLNKDTVNYFAHPFENGMKLIPDIHLSKHLSIFDLGDGLANFTPQNKRDVINAKKQQLTAKRGNSSNSNSSEYSGGRKKDNEVFDLDASDIDESDVLKGFE